MNSTNEVRIMYYDATQGRFVVEEMSMGVNETMDSSTQPEVTTSNTSDSSVE
jgi:hypothetical protein